MASVAVGSAPGRPANSAGDVRTVIVRRLVGLEALVGNNEVAGFKFATLGVIYAVLLGLAVIAVWDKFSDADGATTQEAAALASLYRLASGLDPEAQLAMRDALSRYAKSAIDDDWPAMADGLESEKTLDALNGLYGAALALDAKDARGAVLLETAITELDRITEARRVRLGLGEGIVPSVVWLVLLAGAATTLGFTFFFGLENHAGPGADDRDACSRDLSGAFRRDLDQPSVHRTGPRRPRADRAGALRTRIAA